MEQQDITSGGVRVATPAEGQGASIPPKHGHTLLVVGTVIILLILGAGGYYFWSSGLWEIFMPASTQTPTPSETSDIEADLQSVDVGTDAEADGLEAQF